MTLFLTPQELEALTGRKIPSAQHRALNAMGIEHKRRPDGSIVVLRSHLEAVMGGPARQQDIPEPDWEALDDAAA